MERRLKLSTAKLTRFFWALLLLFDGVRSSSQNLADAIDELVDAGQVVADLDKLATFSDVPSPAVTRVVFTKSDMDARNYITKLMEDAGLKVRSDPMGNIFGRWEGSKPNAPVVLTGSHVDAIPMSGKYDGTVGVIGPIHAIKVLKKAGFRPVHPIEIIMFTSEEPTRFQISCIGSRGLSGATSAEFLDSQRDASGSTFVDAANAAGYGGQNHSEILLKTALDPRNIASFIELHIEQGPLLEDGGIDVGVVTAIAAPASIKASFFGDGGHAGALLMDQRNDAGLAAAELALHVENAVLSSGSSDTVGTTGKIEIEPNAINSVPRTAHVEIDIRDIEAERRDRVVAEVLGSINEIAETRRVRHLVKIVSQDQPASCSFPVMSALTESIHELGLSSMDLVSRAYHDSLFMSRIAPTGMLFIPCQGGISHRPEEYASPEAIGKGVKVLALALAKIALNAPPDASEIKTEL